MIVTHADSRPVRPVEVDAVLIGMGERYVVVVVTDKPGGGNLVASSVERQDGAGRAGPCYGTGMRPPLSRPLDLV